MLITIHSFKLYIFVLICLLQQLNDSSLIVSLLESYTKDKAQTIEKLLAFYPELESKNAKGKTVYEYPNKYFVMQGELSGSTATEQK